MSYRKIVVNDINYSYKVGKSFVEIRDESFKRIGTIPCGYLKGMSEEQFKKIRSEISCCDEAIIEFAKWEINMGSILPSDIERYIKENIQ